MGEIQEDDDSRRGQLPIKGFLQRILELESIPRRMEGQDPGQGKSQSPRGASSHEGSETKGKPELTLKNCSLRKPIWRAEMAIRRGAPELTKDSQLTPGEDFFILGG